MKKGWNGVKWFLWWSMCSPGNLSPFIIHIWTRGVLLHTINQGGKITYSWIKETDLANLGRHTLHSTEGFSHIHPGGENIQVDIFCTPYQYSLADQEGRLCHVPESSLMKALPFRWGWGIVVLSETGVHLFNKTGWPVALPKVRKALSKWLLILELKHFYSFRTLWSLTDSSGVTLKNRHVNCLVKY